MVVSSHPSLGLSCVATLPPSYLPHAHWPYQICLGNSVPFWKPGAHSIDEHRQSLVMLPLGPAPHFPVTRPNGPFSNQVHSHLQASASMAGSFLLFGPRLTCCLLREASPSSLTCHPEDPHLAHSRFHGHAASLSATPEEHSLLSTYLFMVTSSH